MQEITRTKCQRDRKRDNKKRRKLKKQLAMEKEIQGGMWAKGIPELFNTPEGTGGENG
jgi:hypothetical protein